MLYAGLFAALVAVLMLAACMPVTTEAGRDGTPTPKPTRTPTATPSPVQQEPKPDLVSSQGAIENGCYSTEEPTQTIGTIQILEAPGADERWYVSCEWTYLDSATGKVTTVYEWLPAERPVEYGEVVPFFWGENLHVSVRYGGVYLTYWAEGVVGHCVECPPEPEPIYPTVTPTPQPTPVPPPPTQTPRPTPRPRQGGR